MGPQFAQTQFSRPLHPLTLAIGDMATPQWRIPKVHYVFVHDSMWLDWGLGVTCVPVFIK